MIELVTIPLFAFFSRIWGGGFYFEIKDSRLPYDILRKVCQFAYGGLAGFMLTHVWWIAALTSILFWLGEKPNWTPLIDEVSGLKPEEPNLIPRLAARGFVFVSLCLPLAYFYPTLLAFGFMIVAFPLAAILAYRVLPFKTSEQKHKAMELLRGFIFGVCIVAVAL